MLNQGREIAEKLKTTLVEDDNHRPANCAKQDCLVIIDSEHADIGTAGKADSPTIYAVVYDVRNGYGDASKKASLLLAKAKSVVKDAYKKRLTLCACE